MVVRCRGGHGVVRVSSSQRTMGVPELGPGELEGLMGKRKGAAVAAVAAMGGVPGLAARLKTDAARGLPDEAAVREARAKFGENKIPPRASKSFLELCWMAMQVQDDDEDDDDDDGYDGWRTRC